MIIFAVNILLFLIVLGVWLWMDTRKKSKQKDVVVDAEDSCKSGYRFFFWLFLRFLIYVLVTVLLFTIMLSFYEDDYPEDSLSWLMIFAILGWFISIPIVLVYICSLVESVRVIVLVNGEYLALFLFRQAEHRLYTIELGHVLALVKQYLAVGVIDNALLDDG